jgi:hypothetical protein
VVVVIKHTKGHEVLLFTHPLLRSKTECFSFQKTGTRESRERGSIGERERGRERERERESRPRRAWRKIFHDCNARYKPKFPLSGFSSRGFEPLPEIPFQVFFLFLFCID